MNHPVIGVLGGTFDPVHRGHVQLAQAAIRALPIDQVRCVPAGNPPHRDQPCASPADRLAITRLAFAELPQCVVDDAEVRASAPSWTIHTLERLRAKSPDVALVLIVGADAFLGLPTWHRWQELLHVAHIAVANRPGSPLETMAMTPELAELWQTHTAEASALSQSPAGKIVSFTMTPCAISATAIRQAVRSGETISNWVPPAVENYIRQHHLYV